MVDQSGVRDQETTLGVGNPEVGSCKGPDLINPWTCRTDDLVGRDLYGLARLCPDGIDLRDPSLLTYHRGHLGVKKDTRSEALGSLQVGLCGQKGIDRCVLHTDGRLDSGLEEGLLLLDLLKVRFLGREPDAGGSGHEVGNELIFVLF
jgi:hypothetical protein